MWVRDPPPPNSNTALKLIYSAFRWCKNLNFDKLTLKTGFVVQGLGVMWTWRIICADETHKSQCCFRVLLCALQACCICVITGRSTCLHSRVRTLDPSSPCRGWSSEERSPSAAPRPDTRPTSHSTPNPSTGAKFTSQSSMSLILKWDVIEKSDEDDDDGVCVQGQRRGEAKLQRDGGV